MKRTSVIVCALLLALASAPIGIAQTSTLVSNTWSSGAPIPTPLAYTMTAVVEDKIYVAGGYMGPCCEGTVVADVQIYDPAKNTWRKGVPLPTARWSGAAVALDGILYVIGGTTPTGLQQVNTVWAFDPKTSTWSVMAPMPTARSSMGVVVKNGIIYVVGGYNDGGARLNNLESYDPTTDSWTELAPLLVGKSDLSVALIGDTIVAADGYTYDGYTGDNEVYDIATNKWTALAPDPILRDGACAGHFKERLITAGGYAGEGPGAPAINSAESFGLPTNTWETLAPIPQATLEPGSATYHGQLYCISGWEAAYGTLLDSVQIYQP